MFIGHLPRSELFIAKMYLLALLLFAAVCQGKELFLEKLSVFEEEFKSHQ